MNRFQRRSLQSIGAATEDALDRRERCHAAMLPAPPREDALFLAHRRRCRVAAVKTAFDIEQGVDAFDRFERDRRDRRRVVATPGIGRNTANSKNCLRAWAQQRAAVIGPGAREGSYSSL